MDIVTRLKEKAQKGRIYPSTIQAVLVFSGPGTYYDRLKTTQQTLGGEWRSWMDRDRIRAGAAVCREVTATRKSELLGKPIHANQVTDRDILMWGPLYVYNGIPIENTVFSEATDSPFCVIPKERIVMMRTVEDYDGTTHPFRHTGDQVRGLYNAIRDPKSPLFGVENVALVAHVPDHARIPFYTEKNNREHMAEGGNNVNLWLYGLKSRPGAEEHHLPAELARLPVYAAKGDLAPVPSPFSL